MAWSSGVFSRIHNWVNDRDAAIKILATRHDAEDDGFATGINTCLTKDGQNSPTANLPMANFRHTGVGVAQARNDYLVASQLQDSAITYIVDTGAADAYALVPIIAITSYVTGNLFWFKAANDNTGASTIDISTVGVKSLLKQVDTELDAGDIQSGGIYGAFYDGTNFQLISPISATSVDLNHLAGLVISNGTDTDHDIDIAVGEAADSTNDQLIKLSSVITKQIDANWTAGTAAGGFPSGLTLSNTTWYHVFLIKDVTGGTVDAGYDTSLTATNLLADATDYTLFRRIGSVLTDGSANIEQFHQIHDRFLWDAPKAAFSGTPSSTGVNTTMTTPLGVETVVVGQALFDVTGTVALMFLSYQYPGATNTAASGSNAINLAASSAGAFDGSSGCQFLQRTNTSSQIRRRASAASGTERLNTEGWIDFRGKD